MPSLFVHNIPDELYKRIRSRARAHSHTITAKVLQLIQRALLEEVQDQQEIFRCIRQRRFFRPAAVYAPDSTSLLREDLSR